MKRKTKTNGKNQIIRDKQSRNSFAKYRGIGLGEIKTKTQMDGWLKDLRGRDE